MGSIGRHHINHATSGKPAPLKIDEFFEILQMAFDSPSALVSLIWPLFRNTEILVKYGILLVSIKRWFWVLTDTPFPLGWHKTRLCAIFAPFPKTTPKTETELNLKGFWKQTLHVWNSAVHTAKMVFQMMFSALSLGHTKLKLGMNVLQKPQAITNIHMF